MAFDPIIAGQAVEGFLSNSVIQQIFRERKLLYFEEWLASKDPAERERIHAKVSAFDDLGIALRAVADAGLHERALPELERRSE